MLFAQQVFRVGGRCAYHKRGFFHRFEVMYWREGNDEVDFVLRKNRKVVAIEVKSNGEAATTGLARFRQLFSPASAFIVGDSGIKPEVFLGMNLNGLFA